MVNEENLVHLKEICRQLWLGHASLMVGCGFSRNAERATSSTPYPPDWGKLADELIARLYPTYDEKTRENISVKKNVLQLAEEFEVSFQRPALNHLLKELIQDNNLLPGSLHKKLLELPWTDIYTTNYDTLLERTAKEIINIKYDTVLDCNDLPYSEAPRIIKLHGSFPSESTHLIVTEEDYRTYPDKYRPFVNSVQQTIMETTMCLIGFSGTDPNFLKWIGWVKDNLKDSMPPIYLIGLLNLSNAERQVLERKNIIPVDLSTYGNQSKNHEQVLDEFCSFMTAGKPSYIDWPKNKETLYLAPLQNESADTIIATLEYWEKQRKDFPNWLYLPWQKRAELQTFTEQWTFNLEYLKQLPNDWDIRGLYELNWRLEKCLMPIPKYLISDYDGILKKYFFLSSDITGKEIKNKWLDLCFSVLRWSREELNQEVWSRYETIINQSIGKNIAQKNQLQYERILFALSVPDLTKVDNLIKEWECMDHPLIWKVKFASIMAEMGNVDTAIQHWETALNELRPYLPKSRIKKDFYLLGIEGCILVNLGMANNYKEYALYLKNKNAKNNQNQKTKTEETQIQFRERLNELKKYECNPWDMLEKFSLSLDNKGDNKEITTRRDFDRTTTTHHFRNGWNPSVTSAYQFLRFLEETAIPFQVGYVTIARKTIQDALVHLAGYSPAWCMLVLNRIGSKDVATPELLFSQEIIHHLSSDKVDQLLDNYIEQLRYILSKHSEHLNHLCDDCYKKIAKNLYDIVSRLSAKASSSNLKKMLTLGSEIYTIDNPTKFFVFEKIGSRFFYRILKAMTPEQIFENLAEILNIKIPLRPETFWESPVMSLDWKNFKSSPSNCSDELRLKIDYLIQELDNSDDEYRFNLLVYLDRCITINIFSLKQKRKLANTLAKYIQPNQLLPNDNFYKFAYLKFLKPIKRKLNIVEILKKYYLENSQRIFPMKDGKLSMPIGETPFVIMANCMTVTCSVFNERQEQYFDLSQEECLQFLCTIKESWDAQRDCIVKLCQTHESAQSNSDSMFENFRTGLQRTISWLDKLLGEVIIPRINAKQAISEVEQLKISLESYFDLPLTNVSLFTKEQKVFSDKFTTKVMEALVSNNEQIFDIYAGSLFNAYRFVKKKMLTEPPPILFQTLIATIGLKSDACFRSACSIVGSIINYYGLTPEHCSILLIYLKNLLDETDFDSSTNRFNLADRIDYRQASMFLACKMHCYYTKKKTAIPSILLKWKDLANSTEEFPNIRNTWMREVNND